MDPLNQDEICTGFLSTNTIEYNFIVNSARCIFSFLLFWAIILAKTTYSCYIKYLGKFSFELNIRRNVINV